LEGSRKDKGGVPITSWVPFAKWDKVGAKRGKKGGKAEVKEEPRRTRRYGGDDHNSFNRGAASCKGKGEVYYSLTNEAGLKGKKKR